MKVLRRPLSTQHGSASAPVPLAFCSQLTVAPYLGPSAPSTPRAPVSQTWQALWGLVLTLTFKLLVLAGHEELPGASSRPQLRTRWPQSPPTNRLRKQDQPPTADTQCCTTHKPHRFNPTDRSRNPLSNLSPFFFLTLSFLT